MAWTNSPITDDSCGTKHDNYISANVNIITATQWEITMESMAAFSGLNCFTVERAFTVIDIFF